MKVTFQFDVPKWLYRLRWKNLKNYALFYLRPYRCEDCSKRMPFGHFDIWKETSPRLGIGYTNCVCPSCLAKRLDKVLAQPHFVAQQREDTYNIADKCGVCGAKGTAFKAIRMSKGPIDNMRFCANGSWNGNYVCLSCIYDTLKDGEMKSSIYGIYNGKMVPTNGRGLPVIDGKVKFPEK